MLVIFFLICIAFIEMNYCKQTDLLSSYMMIAVMAFIMGGSIVNSDYEGYKLLYENSIYFNIEDFFDYEKSLKYWYPRESGYAFINSIFVTSGFVYVEFKTIAAFIFLTVGHYIIQKLTKSTNSTNKILGVYLFFPFFMDVIQIRNFYSMILLLLGIYLYVKKQSVKKYLIVALIAVTLHTTSIVMFLYITVDRLINRKYCKMIIIFCVIVGLCFPLYLGAIEKSVGNGYDFLLTDANYAINAYSAYASDALEGKFGKIIIYIYVVVMMFITRRISIHLEKEELPHITQAFVKMIYHIHLCVVILLPILALTTQFVRFPRNLLLADYIVLAIYYKYCSYNKNTFKYIISAMAVIFMFAVYGLYWNYGDEVVNIIDNNYYIDVLF